MKTLSVCEFDGCSRATRSASSPWCSRHYQQKNRDAQRARGLCILALCSEHPVRGSSYCARHKRLKIAAAKIWHTPEYSTVAAHLNHIRTKHPAYRGMPFYAAWDSTRGGSIKAGEAWIVSHLGRRPAVGYDMHVVDRRIGFMPGNLQWVPRGKHRREEMLNALLREVQQLKTRLAAFES